MGARAAGRSAGMGARGAGIGAKGAGRSAGRGSEAVSVIVNSTDAPIGTQTTQGSGYAA